MKPFTILPLALLLLVPVPGRAQDKVELPAIGVSVDVPAEWEEVQTFTATDGLPDVALYHVMNTETGQAIAIRRDECITWSRRMDWVEGRLAEELAWPGDVLQPLPAEHAVQFGQHTGFKMTRQQGNEIYQSYLFYLAMGHHCFQVALMAPADLFADSAPAFQQIVDDLQFATAR